MKILVVGELNPDLILRNYSAFPCLGQEVLVEDCTLTLGSASAICAVGLAKLGDAVRFAGLVGQDQWGDFSLQALVNAGIDTSGVRRDASVKTGITISITSAADRAFVTHLGAIAAFRAAHLDSAVMDGCGHLHISSYFLQEGLRGDCRALFAEAHRRGMTTSLDPGFDPTEKWDSGLRDTLTEVDVFFPNEVELRGAGASDEPIECLRRLDNGRTLVVAKLGREGCMALDGGSAVHVPAFAVEAVDTTGAGDSFNAGFLHAWLGRRPLKEAMRFAAACGALSTRAMGGTGSQATESEAEEMLNGTTGN
ncbi:MAG: carbohydrate kinase family protein [Bryobacteraceae bacterium]